MAFIALAFIALAFIALAFIALIATTDQAAHAVPAGQVCGGIAGAACDKGLWCEPIAGKCASSSGTQAGSQAGVCVAVPKLCIARKNGKSFQPVCGCNSKTYSNDCFRRAYRVAKFHDGKC
ncbi:MAG: hypothetical protein K2X43_14015 [Hyphomonadaceae bacterium]|nr:hypothetical protein [Hyphomonadaceae bacterium]